MLDWYSPKFSKYFEKELINFKLNRNGYVIEATEFGDVLMTAHRLNPTNKENQIEENFQKQQNIFTKTKEVQPYKAKLGRNSVNEKERQEEDSPDSTIPLIKAAQGMEIPNEDSSMIVTWSREYHYILYGLHQIHCPTVNVNSEENMVFRIL